MANPIKVSSGSTEYPALYLPNDNNVPGNLHIYIGASDYPYGPSESSGFYAGYAPTNILTTYTVYYPTGEGTFLIYYASNDNQLKVIIQQLFPNIWSIIGDNLPLLLISLRRYIFNRDYENIVLDDLSLCIDVGFIPSFPKSGSSIKSISKTFSENITVLNAPSYIPNFFVFDGTNDYLTGFNIPTSTNGNTVEMWLGPPISSGFLPLFKWSDHSLSIVFSGDTFGVYNGNDSLYSVDVSDLSGGNRYLFSCYVPNNWSSNYTDTKIWINGVEQTITVNTGGYQNVTLTSSEDIIIGKDSTNYFFGVFALCRTYQRELTDDEVLYNFNAQKSRYGY